MATILAHITVQEGKEKEFEEVLHRLWRSTHEHEDHVLRYEYWRGAEKNQYYGLLSFNDYNGFLEHQTSDHHETDAKLLTHLSPISAWSGLTPFPRRHHCLKPTCSRSSPTPATCGRHITSACQLPLQPGG